LTPDGSPVDVYLAMPATGEPELIDRALAPGADILELGCGAGRVTHRLLDLGRQVVAVDQSPEMLAHVRGAETVRADIETLRLPRRFGGVVLASHLVNSADRAQRRAFLATCAEHLAPQGSVLIQRLDPARPWTPGRSGSSIGPVELALHVLGREGDVISASLDYRLAGRTFTQTFSAEILDDATLDRELAAAGLRRRAWLDPSHTWLTARCG
jgi:SAM-dependent methyltransferase